MFERKYSIFVIAYIIFIVFNLVFSGGRIGYDTARNEKIITEMSYYGTFTYFDVPFIVSPPLYFIMHSFPVSLLGSEQVVFKFTEATMYFLGALLAFFIVREFGLTKKISIKMGFLVFFLLLIDGQMFRIVHNIDFEGSILLFSSLLLLFYIRLFKKSNFINILGFGVFVGLSMLIKSSFIFFIIPLVLHYLIFNSMKRDVNKIVIIFVSLFIGIVVYSPWLFYLSSNGFPLITNPEASGELPWDPNFSGYTFQDVYMNLWYDYWPLLYPFSILVGSYLIYSYYRSVKFEDSVKLVKRVKYCYYKYGNSLGCAFIALLMVIVLLPFFNRFLVAIPVGEQFLSIALSFYLLIGVAFFKAKDIKLRTLITLVLVVNFFWGAMVVSPVFAEQEHQNACDLYSDFFDSLESDKALLIDERLSRIAYPAHNVLYKPFFEWFSYQENYDLLRIITFNVDYIVLIESDKIPAYLLDTSSFERVGEYNCEDLRGKTSYNAAVFSVVDIDSLAGDVGLGERGEFVIMSDDKPVQATVLVSGTDFNIEYKSKRDGSLNVYFPGPGEYNIQVVRPGFKPKNMAFSVPSVGNTLINLERDSPLVTHTTANRY